MLMLGFKTLLHPPISSISRPFSSLPQSNLHLPSFLIKTPSRFSLFAHNNDKNNLTQEPKQEPEQEKQNNPIGNSGGGSYGGGGGGGNADGDDLRKDQIPLFNIKWGDLLLDPDPDNLLAVGLTGLLTWASVNVLWQLFIVSLAIVVAALKYSFIAALLIFILVTLL